MAIDALGFQLQQAHQAYLAGNPQRAAQLLAPLMATHGRHPGVLALLGAVKLALGEAGEAVKAFRKVVDLKPADLSMRVNLGTAQRAAGQRDAANASYREVERRGWRDAGFLYSYALLLSELGDVGGARMRLAEAARQRPDDGEIQLRYAECCFLCSDHDEVARVLNGLPRWRGLNEEGLAIAASLNQQVGRGEQAEQMLAHLLALNSTQPWTLLCVVEMLERLNRVDEADSQLQRLLELLGTSTELELELRKRLLAVQAKVEERKGQLAQARAHLETALSVMSNPAERHLLLYPLAKLLDRIGDVEAAMDAASRAHADQLTYLRSFAARELGEDREVMAITQFCSEAEDIAAWRDERAPAVAESPIFIVAFPRSGTTLLEQALDAHPQLLTMDEQPFLQQILVELRQAGHGYPARLAELPQAALDAARARYWALVGGKVALQPGQRLIDKNPLNMLRLPLIKRLFPHASILLAIRHPADVITSNYFQHYSAPEFARLCSDLPTLALAWRRAFDFWYAEQTRLQPRVHEVFYERFIGDFEPQLRSIAEFLQIGWDEAMLAPGEHARRKGYISTPSYTQVVQPINNKAVGRWRRYERWMGPVMEQTAPYLRRWGYE